MNLEPEFLALLRAPVSLLPLRLASPAELEALNQKIRVGGMRTRGGSEIATTIDAGLVCEGEAVLFPIVDGIPILLRDEAIPI